MIFFFFFFFFFSETVIVYDIKFGRSSQSNEYIKFYEYLRSKSSLTLVQGHSHSTFSNFFSRETARAIEAKFHVDPPWNGGMKVSTNDFCHMTKIAAMSIYGKSL